MSLLFTKRPLVVNTELAVAVGLNEAIVLQQLHYWLSTNSGVEHQGRRWVHNTMEEWRDNNFPFLSKETVKRTFASLKKMGLVLTDKLAEDKHNKTNYYTIVYESPVLTDGVKMTSSNRSDCADGAGQTDTMDGVKMTSSNRSDCANVTEITSENINPIHSENKISPAEIAPAREPPDYPCQPGVLFSASPPTGKFSMHPGWEPSPDFVRYAALWGRAIPDGMNRQNWQPVLNSFIAYWQAEGKFFHQVQWEQKFATQLQRAVAEKRHTRGTKHAEPDSVSTANAAVQKIRAAREQHQRTRGQGMDILGNHGGDLLQPVDDQKRLGTLRPLDCPGREFNQRPDDGDL